MCKLLLSLLCVYLVCANADTILTKRKGASLKPMSVCCEIPELGEASVLNQCSETKLAGPCDDVQCIFEKSGFLVGKLSLNKEAYRNHLKQWSEKNKGWSDAIDKAIEDCVDKDLRQYLSYPCKAFDVFTCTGIAMLKKCPKDFWKC